MSLGATSVVSPSNFYKKEIYMNNKGLKEFALDMIKDIMPDILEENKKILECSKHDFGTVPPVNELTLYPYVSCSKCGGVFDIGKAITYAVGYKAAGGDINDVLKGYE